VAGESDPPITHQRLWREDRLLSYCDVSPPFVAAALVTCSGRTSDSMPCPYPTIPQFLGRVRRRPLLFLNVKLRETLLLVRLHLVQPSENAVLRKSRACLPILRVSFIVFFSIPHLDVGELFAKGGHLEVPESLCLPTTVPVDSSARRCYRALKTFASHFRLPFLRRPAVCQDLILYREPHALLAAAGGSRDSLHGTVCVLFLSC